MSLALDTAWVFVDFDALFRENFSQIWINFYTKLSVPSVFKRCLKFRNIHWQKETCLLADTKLMQPLNSQISSGIQKVRYPQHSKIFVRIRFKFNNTVMAASKT